MRMPFRVNKTTGRHGLIAADDRMSETDKNTCRKASIETSCPTNGETNRKR